MGYQPPLPNSARLIDWGHSWVAPPSNPYGRSGLAAVSSIGGINSQGSYPWDGEQWPVALRDALGIGSVGYTKSYQVPAVATAANATTFLDLMPEDGTIESVYFVPNGVLTGANTNTRLIGIQVGQWLVNPTTIQSVQFNSGVNMALGVPIKLFSINDVTGLIAPGTSGIGSPFFAALRGVGNNTNNVLTPQELYWVSTHIGSGLADPGGTVIVRYGTRYRNYGVAGSSLLVSIVGSGGWVTPFTWSPYSHPNGIEVNTTSASAATTTTIACQALRYPLLSGQVVYFANGFTATLTANANFRATSLTVAALANTIPANAQGHARSTLGANASSGETLSPTGIHVWTHGVNDANSTLNDPNAWGETARSVIARSSCPVWNFDEANIVFANGGGAWVAGPFVYGGMLPYSTDPSSQTGNNPQIWTGSAPTSGDTITISVGPAFEGGVIDLFFLGLAGTGFGVAASVEVDGSNPPQGAVTLNTSGVSTSGLLSTSLGTIAAVASTTVTGTGFTAGVNLTGQTLIASGVPAGVFISSVQSNTSLTASQPITVASLAGTALNYVPMVKRLTGLAAGAHTIVVTITGADSAQSALGFIGMGIESLSPPTPVLWCNIAQCPFQTATQLSHTTTYNTRSAAVIAGTVAPLTGNTAEPAFGTNVQYVDINSLFGNSAQYFIDGIHLNSQGHRLMARTLFSVLRNNFSPDQLISR